MESEKKKAIANELAQVVASRINSEKGDLIDWLTVLAVMTKDVIDALADAVNADAMKIMKEYAETILKTIKED